MSWFGFEKIRLNNMQHLSDGLVHDILEQLDLRQSADFVWYDPETNKIVNPLETRRTNPTAAFLDDASNFIDNRRFGEPSFSAKSYINKDVDYRTTEMILAGYNRVKEVRGSKVLIVGAGPSAKDFSEQWKSKIPEYDYIWSCNHYFLPEFLEDIKFDLISLGNEVDITSEKLLERLDRDKSTIAIDTVLSRTQSEFSTLVSEKKDKIIYYSTRFFGSIGTIPRMLVLAKELGASKISFVGMDGLILNEDSSCFEKGKRTNNAAVHGPLDKKVYKTQYLSLWNYLLGSNSGQVEFHNYGCGHRYNMTGDIPNRKK